ncbi:class I SAM-dependent methyltransferase [Frankia sp. AgB32]|uniref:methyltransferase domain-containing protein n=1 Tax=Frankia sp. AgB32 TaxID=631119 RepID=UPI002010C015|nr:class I SAM-dependent methyltransferase [Frankia sp. AgB32]MCK9896085.1 class I SAM-dependent methyltransferase [Frankia sp. AgB32]
MTGPTGDRKITNAKAAAWDGLGSAYWNRAYDGGPSPAACAQYLDGTARGQRVLLVGASTVSLARAALDVGAELVVADFSAVMLAELAVVLPGGAEFALVDVTRADAPFDATFDLVVADRLLNRFVLAELRAALRTLTAAVRPGGLTRLSYRSGLYERDRVVLAEAARRGVLTTVFDEAEFDVDYSAAAPWLAAVLPRHGDIPMAALIDFYVARGREHRIRPGELDELAAQVVPPGVHYETAHPPVPGQGDDFLFELRRLT